MKRFLIALLLLWCVACSSDNSHKTFPATTIKPTDATTDATVLHPVFGSAPVSSAETAPSTLNDIDVGKHDGFTRVVLRFREHVPGFAVQHEGDGISVRLNANAHDDAGEVTVPRHTGGVDVVEAVDVVEDFEGVVNLMIETSSVLPYKVFTLTKPSRLVIDVKST